MYYLTEFEIRDSVVGTVQGNTHHKPLRLPWFSNSISITTIDKSVLFSLIQSKPNCFPVDSSVWNTDDNTAIINHTHKTILTNMTSRTCYRLLIAPAVSFLTFFSRKSLYVLLFSLANPCTPIYCCQKQQLTDRGLISSRIWHYVDLLSEPEDNLRDRWFATRGYLHYLHSVTME